MKIFADENMPLVTELFSQHAEIVRGPGRSLTREQLTDVDVLLVRSVTKVDAELLQGFNVKFVASATSGTDHIDTAYLQHAGIEFAYAPGSNANSVAEYVVAALLSLATRDNYPLDKRTVGIIGLGQVGSRVAAKCRALAMQTLINDPPLAAQPVKLDFVELNDLLDVDILTLHVPLTFKGPFPTVNLIDYDWLSRIKKPGMIVFNTSRGRVLDEQALWNARSAGLIGPVVLDVFEAEKTPQRVADAALKRAEIATPHIAGYSYDGKVAGTVMLYQALAKRFAWPLQTEEIDALNIQPKDLAPPPPDAGYNQQLDSAVRQAYDIQQDHEELQKALTRQGPDRGTYFDTLRKDYPLRREFHNYRVSTEQGYSAQAVETLTRLGFVK